MYPQMLLLPFTPLTSFNPSRALAFTISSLHAYVVLLKPFLEHTPVDHCMEAVSVTFIGTFGHLLASLQQEGPGLLKISKTGTLWIYAMMVFFTPLCFQIVALHLVWSWVFGPLQRIKCIFFHGTVDCNPEILSLVGNGQLMAHHCSEVILLRHIAGFPLKKPMQLWGRGRW